MGEYRYTFWKFLKDWALIIGMIVGASLYLVYHAIPALHPAGPVLERIVKHVQPVLLFAMLFLSFNKIAPSQMRPHRWHIGIIATQLVLVALVVAVILWLDTQTPTPITQHLSPNTYHPSPTHVRHPRHRLRTDSPVAVTAGLRLQPRTGWRRYDFL
jgi:hypothetical protein